MIMKKILFTVLLGAGILTANAQEKADTLYVSDQFTSHIVFSTDVIYADLSNPNVLAAKIVDQSKNLVAIKARARFDKPVSVSALESNGKIHTFIVIYKENPSTLVIDYRPADNTAQAGERKTVKDDKVTVFRAADAPMPKEVLEAERSIWHIASRSNDIEVACRNILAYSDITYIVFGITNHSGVSYECSNASFAIESRKNGRKSVVYDENIVPKSRYGSLSAGPGETSSIVYTLPKISLTDQQVLKVYFYEEDGPREVVLTFSSKDINKAKNSI